MKKIKSLLAKCVSTRGQRALIVVVPMLMLSGLYTYLISPELFIFAAIVIFIYAVMIALFYLLLWWVVNGNGRYR